MNVVLSGRAGGKSHAMLRWLAVDPRHRAVVVSNQAQVRWLLLKVADHFPDSGIGPQNFVGVSEALGGALRGRSVALAVDNVDLVLCSLFGDVQIVTATGDVLRPENVAPAWSPW